MPQLFQRRDLAGLVAVLPAVSQRLSEEIVGGIIFGAQQRLDALRKHVIPCLRRCAVRYFYGRRFRLSLLRLRLGGFLFGDLGFLARLAFRRRLLLYLLNFFFGFG